MPRERDAFGDDIELLVKDFGHWEQTYATNEELGEKRLSFFMGVITATFGGIAFLSKEGATIADVANLHMAAAFAALVLFLFGLLTLLRIKRRNTLTTQHLGLLDGVRARLAPAWATEVGRVFPPSQSRRRPLVNGGLLHVAGLLNCALAAIFTWSLLHAGTSPHPALALGTALAASVGAVLLQRHLLREPPADEVVPDTFRAGVGLVVANAEGLVLALERADRPDAWQLPQGGIEPGESVEQARARELCEETGLGREHVDFVTELPVLLAYELPEDARKPKTGRGQVHRWALYHLRRDAERHLRPGKEASKLDWMPLEQLARRTAEFRRPVYEALYRELGPKLRPWRG